MSEPVPTKFGTGSDKVWKQVLKKPRFVADKYFKGCVCIVPVKILKTPYAEFKGVEKHC